MLWGCAQYDGKSNLKLGVLVLFLKAMSNFVISHQNQRASFMWLPTDGSTESPQSFSPKFSFLFAPNRQLFNFYRKSEFRSTTYHKTSGSGVTLKIAAVDKTIFSLTHNLLSLLCPQLPVADPFLEKVNISDLGEFLFIPWNEYRERSCSTNQLFITNKHLTFEFAGQLVILFFLVFL